jgi:hypothetical protein
MTFVRNLPLPVVTLCEPSPGTLRITLSNSAQGRHLHGALLGHCEADLVAGSDGTAVGVVVNENGSRNVLRRVDAWLSEFGVASAALEFNGRMYQMTKS